jgi:hypothetical protein
MMIRSAVFVLCLCFNGAAPSHAQQTPSAPQEKPPVKSVRLTVVPRDGMTRNAPDNGKYDCGMIDLLQTQHVERIFTLKNETGAPIALDAIRTSCGCQSMVLLKNGQTVQQTTLAPGEHVEIKLGVSLSRIGSKEKRVSAWAHNRNQVAPLAVMEMAMQIETPVRFQPPTLTFRQAGETQTVTVRADARLVGAKETLTLTGGKPLFETTAVGTPRHVTESGKTWIETVYRVTLKPNAPSGFQGAVLALLLSTAEKSDKSGAALLQKIAPTLTVTSDIVPDIRCQPDSVAFGVIPANSPATRRVLVFARTAAELSGLKVNSIPSWLQMSLFNETAPRLTAQGYVSILELALSPDIPSGQHQTTLLLQNAQGKSFSLPISVQREK